MGVRFFPGSIVCIAAAFSACGGNTSSNGSGGQSGLGTGGRPQVSTGGRAEVTTGGRVQGTGGGGGVAGMGASCSEQSPAGCVVNACPPSYVCDRTVGCTPSSCTCTKDGWACDDECNGGTCVPLDPPTDPAVCEKIAAELAMQVGPVAQTGTCTAVVRLDYRSLKVLGHTFVCGPYDGGGEQKARAAADAAATFPNAQPAGQGRLLLSGETVGSEWLFYQTPGDFGGASAVSARSGLTVFAGSIVWAGTGSLLVPSKWETTELGTGCASFMFPVRAFDLTSGAELKNGEANAAVNVVFGSAIPSALAKIGGVFDAVVLLYPRTVGLFEPETAEYVVLLNGGALIGD